MNDHDNSNPNSDPIREQAMLLNQESWNLKYEDLKKAIEKAEQSLAISRKSGYSLGEAYALTYLSLLRFWSTIEDNYLKNLYRAYDIFKSTNELTGLARVTNILATFFDHYGDYNKGIEFCLESVRISEQKGLKEEESDALTTLGQIYLRLADYSNAINSFESSLHIRVNLNNKKAISSSYNLLARTYTLSRDYDKASLFYAQSLELRKETGDTTGIPWTYLGMATLAESRNQPEEAISYYRLGLQLNETSNNKRYDLLCKMGIGKLLLKKKALSESKPLLDDALIIAEKIESNPLLAEINLLLSNWYEENNDSQKALKYLRRYIELKEQIMNEENTNNLKNQQIAFGVEKARKEAEIYQLKNIELKNAYDKIEEKNTEILDSINYANRIQQAVISPESIFSKYFPHSFILYLPKDIVSGDFYWISKTAKRIIFTVADCTGHGVPGAFVSIIGKLGLDRCVNEFRLEKPSDILDQLNAIVTETFVQSVDKVKDGMDIALCSIDNKTNTLEFAGAKNPLYLLRNNEITVYKGDRQSIESLEGLIPFINNTIELMPGDRIYLFSDGIVDQFGGPENKKFMQKQLQALLLSLAQLPLKEQKGAIHDYLKNWQGRQTQIDDICLMGLEYQP
jgi:serine phosphatase RsbU (regulator of sigma subunit)